MLETVQIGRIKRGLASDLGFGLIMALVGLGIVVAVMTLGDMASQRFDLRAAVLTTGTR
jgi:Flp pilus assembly pilin Flp